VCHIMYVGEISRCSIIHYIPCSLNLVCSSLVTATENMYCVSLQKISNSNFSSSFSSRNLEIKHAQEHAPAVLDTPLSIPETGVLFSKPQKSRSMDKILTCQKSFLTHALLLQRRASQRFLSMLKNTPWAHQKCFAFLTVLRNRTFLTLAQVFLTLPFAGRSYTLNCLRLASGFL